MTKVALITGATAGIGQATAELLARQGYSLVLCGRRVERLTHLIKRIEESFGVAAYAVPFDIRDRQAVEEAVVHIRTCVDQIDLLINNAGLAAGLDSLRNGSPDDWDQMIDTNVRGLLYISRQIIPWMVEKGSGHIVNVGSIAGKEVYPNGNVYCGTKHMVDALSQAMRRELAEFNIRVSAVHPGAAETEFSLVRYKGDVEKAGKVYDGFQNLLAEDIADAIWYMVSRPAHVNINEIVIMPKAQPAAGVIIRDKGL